MGSKTLRRALAVYVLLLAPICWLAGRFDPYGIDGDAVSYMDIADLLRTHQWAGVVNGYWHPLYPAVLAVGQMLFHPTRMNERGVYVTMNYGVFLLQVAAMWIFVGALVRLRERMSGAKALLSVGAMRLLGLGLLVTSVHRELSLGKVRPDGLLQALLMGGFAMMLELLATDNLWFAPAMGLLFGLAYLAKSFAFLVALLSILVMMVFQMWMQRRPLLRVVATGALAGVVFAAVAGPYMLALSKQKHRFDFGDSGALNYAWFSAGTQKLHLEPGQTERYGTSSVKLVHPVPEILSSPAIYSYKSRPYGTYPDWFDPTYFNERIVPHLNPKVLVRRDARNAVLVLRYLLNHPEGWMLLALLMVCGAGTRFRSWRREGFWVPTLLLGLAMWGIYGLVNIEERYVTLAYLVMLLPVFAMLTDGQSNGTELKDGGASLPRVASAMVAVLAFVTLGQALMIALENRRNSTTLDGHEKQIYGTAAGLAALGVRPGDEVACMETTACVNDPYWARLAGVRVLTEVSNTGSAHLADELDGLANRQQVYDVVKAQGAKVLVASFDPGEMTARTPASQGWVRLGTTNFYALPLNLPAPEPLPARNPPWSEGDSEP